VAVGWLWDDGSYVFHENLLYCEHCMQEHSHGEDTSCISTSHFFHIALLYAVNWTSRILHSLFHLATFLIKPLICNFSDSNNCLYCTVKCVKTEYYTAAGFSLLNHAQR
jgi:hypothetical protein